MNAHVRYIHTNVLYISHPQLAKVAPFEWIAFVVVTATLVLALGVIFLLRPKHSEAEKELLYY